MSLIKRLTQVVSAEELDSSTSRLHLGCEAFNVSWFGFVVQGKYYLKAT